MVVRVEVDIIDKEDLEVLATLIDLYFDGKLLIRFSGDEQR